jgi:hypothetical protein
VNLPVRGSSEFHGKKENIHWDPVKKTPDFNPLQRWSHWGRALHERFNWISGRYLVQFGYEEKRYATNQRLWVVRNKTLDIKWRVETIGQTLKAAIQRRIFRRVTR